MASKKEESEVISADEVKVLPPEIAQRVSTEISLLRSEHNITEEAIAELKERYSGLTIAGPEDKEGYILVQESRKNLKAIRIGIQKGFKRLREIAQLEVKNKIAAEKEVVAQISELEDPLYEQEKSYDAAKEQEKAAKALKIEQQGIRRTSELMSYGAALIEGSWVLGELAYESILCKNCDEDIYQGIRDQFKAIFDANEKTKAEEAEKTRLATEKLLKDQEDLKRMQKEAKDMRTEGRISFLESLGMEKSNTGFIWIYSENESVRLVDIQEKESSEWEVIIAGVKEGMVKANADAKEKEQQKEIFKSRLPKLRGWGYNGLTVSRPTDLEGGMNPFGSKEQLIRMSEAEFGELIAANELSFERWESKKEEKRLKDLEDARIEGIGKSRRQTLTEIQGNYGGTDIEFGNMPQKEWIELYKGVKLNWDATQKVLADKKEKERLEELGEKGRYEELVKYLKAAPIGEYRSSQYRSRVSPIRTYINNL